MYYLKIFYKFESENMPKNLKENKKETKKVKVVEETTEHEDLPEDVKEALGIVKKESKKKIHEVDYIAELENDVDQPPSPFDEMLGDDIE
jgi:hypothetical protein